MRCDGAMSVEPDEKKDAPDPTLGEHLHHWYREPIAGVLALAIGAFDAWHYGRDAGLTSSLDEALVVGGIILIAGTKKLFSTDSK